MPTKTDAIDALKRHFEDGAPTDMRTAFSEDAGRFGKHSAQFEDMLLDWSKCRVDDETLGMIRSCFALGSSRTMQQDVGFGIAQLTDIAVRALSPGVNDPQTARDITMHLGDVLRELWSREEPAAVLTGDGRRVYRTVPDIAEYLHAAFDPIRHYGRSDPAVMTTVAETLVILRREVVRHDLPGPVEPIDDWLDELAATIDTDGWTDRERARLDRALDHDNR